MSTISLSYPDAPRAQRVPALGKILMLSSLVLVTVVLLVLVVSASSTEPTSQAAVFQTAIAPIAAPVPSPSSMEIQSVPTETPAIQPEATSEPSVVPVPLPTPPAPPNAR